jgi:hypothetical protein
MLLPHVNATIAIDATAVVSRRLLVLARGYGHR